MTQEQLLAAINAAGLKAEELTLVLSFAAALVQREKLRAAMAKERQALAIYSATLSAAQVAAVTAAMNLL